MSKRITNNMVKTWLSESAFAVTHGMHLCNWDDYYHIIDDCNNRVCDGRTPGEVWEKFNLLKTGYYMGQREAKNV